VKTNEHLYRRVDLRDAVGAHLLPVERAAAIGFGRYVVSATTPFQRDDVGALRRNAPGVVAWRGPGYQEVYARRGWRMLPTIDRVYDNAAARRDLGWPRQDFQRVVECLRADDDPRSLLARAVGTKGYHR
jgi:UDP-glucose 4-epimerase